AEWCTRAETGRARPWRPCEPMYVPGRLRTASRPSRTVMSLASYEEARWANFRRDLSRVSRCRRPERWPREAIRRSQETAPKTRFALVSWYQSEGVRQGEREPRFGRFPGPRPPAPGGTDRPPKTPVGC